MVGDFVFSPLRQSFSHPTEKVRCVLIAHRLCLALFLSCLEITIVSTALVSISHDLQGFHKDSWIVTSYLLTYTG